MGESQKSLSEEKPTQDEPKLREVRHEYTLNPPELLTERNAALLVSTYQAGKLCVVGTFENQIWLSYHNFEKAMGVAVDGNQLAVGAKAQIWFLRNMPQLASKVEPAGEHDACYLTRTSYFTGEIQGHELAWAADELWIVNTAFSCLCTLDGQHSFVPRWQPKFITALAPEDRCHLNGMAIVDGKPKYVTAMSQTDTAAGWRPTKATSGCVLDVATSEVVAQGFAMPHSPRVYQGRLWALDSGTGRMVHIDPKDGRVDTVARMPGYTRGLAYCGPYAFVGLSKIRETSTFGGVPIAEERESLKCGVGVVDLRDGKLAAHLEFHSGVEEIFSVEILSGVRYPAVSGPYPTLDAGEPIWVVPTPKVASTNR